MRYFAATLNRAIHVLRPDAAIIKSWSLAALLTVSLLLFPSPAAFSQTVDGLGVCAPGVDLVGVSDALDGAVYADQDVGGLSALIHDPTTDTYSSLVDRQGSTPARIFTLSISVTSDGVADPAVIGMTELSDDAGMPFTGETLDGEGLTRVRDGSLLVASETEPSIRRFAPDGQIIGAVPVPERFLVEPHGQAEANKTFESLSMGPGGRNLYTATESPLSSDGWTHDGRGRIRILRYRMNWMNQLQPAGEYFYVTEPGQSVVEVVTLGARRLLVMERGVGSGTGITVRVFHVALEVASDVSGMESLASDEAIPATKTLLVDLADCPSGQQIGGSDINQSLLANFEGVALGPRLDDGRQTLILQSDDNFSPNQVTRIVALAFDNLGAN